MGADIHIFIERAEIFSGKDPLYWFGFGDNIRASRDYEMFGAIAGVRGNLTPIDEPRGYPPDYHHMERQEKDAYGYHSWTHITPDELQDAIVRAMASDDYEHPDYASILRFCRDLESNGSKVRLVIGFDS